jgi:hypothetical protein
MEPQTFQGESLRFKSVAANIVIIPEDRADYSIEIDNSHGRTAMPTVSSDEGRITIDGQLRGRIQDCEGGGASLRGYDNVAAEDLPRITIHAPRALDIDRGGAGATEIGPSQSLDLDFSGCSTATVADVAGDFKLDLAGSGHVQAAAAHSVNADVAGSGELSLGAVADGADVDLAGSGTITIASLAGAFSADGAGSGNIDINGGAITTANIDLAGSGDIDIAAPVQTLTVSIVGSGSVNVTAAVGDINAEIAGSGGVSAQSVTGTVHKEIMGSGDVRVGQ